METPPFLPPVADYICCLYMPCSLSAGGSAVHKQRHGQTGATSTNSSPLHKRQPCLKCWPWQKCPSPGMPSQRPSCHHSRPLRLMAPWTFSLNIVLLKLSCLVGFSKKCTEWGLEMFAKMQNIQQKSQSRSVKAFIAQWWSTPPSVEIRNTLLRHETDVTTDRYFH